MATNIVLDLLNVVYDAGLDGSKWVPALVKLREALGVHSCAILAENRQERQITCTANSGIKDKYLNRLQDNYYSWLGHPVIASARPREMRPGQVLLSNKLIEDDDLRGTPAYKEFFKPQGIFYFCFVPLYMGEAARVNIILNWTKKHGPLKISDLRLFQKIIPHLVRAIRIQNRLQTLESGLDALYTLIDDLSEGVVLLNRRGEVVSLNRAARNIVDGTDLFAIALHERFRVRYPEGAAEVNRLVQHAVNFQRESGRQKRRGGSVTLPKQGDPRQGDEHVYTVMILPIPHDDLLPNFESPSAVVFLGASAAVPIRLELHLASLYGLTATESRLAKLILQGQSLQECGEEMQISMNTVRTHLKRVFNKTNTSRQAQLVAKLATVVYRYALGTK